MSKRGDGRQLKSNEIILDVRWNVPEESHANMVSHYCPKGN